MTLLPLYLVVNWPLITIYFKQYVLQSVCVINLNCWASPFLKIGRVPRSLEMVRLTCACASSYNKQSVVLTGRDRIGPPRSVGRPTAHALSRWRANRPRARRPAGPHAGSVTDDDRWRQQTTDDDRRHPAKQHWPIRRARNNCILYCLWDITAP